MDGFFPALLPRRWGASLLTVLILMLAAWAARAEPAALSGRLYPMSLHARVVWVRDSVAILAGADSIPAGIGDRLTFRRHEKTLAEGTLVRIYDRELARASLTSGSLAGVNDLEQIEVIAEPIPVQRLKVLRMGLPSRARPSLFFACDPMWLDPSGLRGLYHTEQVSARVIRIVRDSSGASHEPWPDTILVRLFDESADEEIALERGELDLGVFWPGELSREIREQPKWKDLLFATRTRGVVAALWHAPRADAGTPTEPAPLTSMNQELCRGDLERWEDAVGGDAHSGPGIVVIHDEVYPKRARFEVGPSLPGRQKLDRFLNRGLSSSGVGTQPGIRLAFLDAPFRDLDSLQAEIARTAGPAGGSMSVDYLYAIRCALVCAPIVRSTLAVLGASTFVNLWDCRSARRP